MGNVPVIHEVATSFASLGDAIVGDNERARQRWVEYSKESIIGSYVAATVEVCKGNEEKSLEYLKGMGRATGKAVLGGGMLSDVPVFHELSVCGESLGDMIGGGDDESARQRWETYAESSVIGSGAVALAAKIDGDDETAKKYAEGFGKAGARFGVTAVAMGATVATAGMAAPLGVGAAATSGAVVGGTVGAGSTAAVQLIDKGKIDDPGAVVGMGLFGASSGALKEAKSARKSAARNAEASKSSSSGGKPESNNSAKGNEASSKPSSSRAGVRSSKRTSNNSSQSNETGAKPPNNTSSTSSTSKPKISKRPRALSAPGYQEAEHFTPNYKSSDVNEMADKKNFSYNGGKAQRNEKFKNVWDPKDRGSGPDRQAAAEAARQCAEGRVKQVSHRERPNVIAVSQDLETGSATASASVNKGNKQALHNKIGDHQKNILGAIENTGSYGKGHGFCGEQVEHNNTTYYRNASEDLFQDPGKVTVQAFSQESKGNYTKPMDPCPTCEHFPKIFRRRSLGSKFSLRKKTKE